MVESRVRDGAATIVPPLHSSIHHTLSLVVYRKRGDVLLQMSMKTAPLSRTRARSVPRDRCRQTSSLPLELNHCHAEVVSPGFSSHLAKYATALHGASIPPKLALWHCMWGWSAWQC